MLSNNVIDTLITLSTFVKKEPEEELSQLLILLKYKIRVILMIQCDGAFMVYYPRYDV